MARAAQAYEEELRHSWHLAKTNHEVWVARKEGALALQRKFENLLTDEDAWV